MSLGVLKTQKVDGNFSSGRRSSDGTDELGQKGFRATTLCTHVAEAINAGRRTSLVPNAHQSRFPSGSLKTPLDARFSLAKKFPSVPINPSVSINFLRFEYIPPLTSGLWN
jgi:hypothetical protein